MPIGMTVRSPQVTNLRIFKRELLLASLRASKFDGFIKKSGENLQRKELHGYKSRGNHLDCLWIALNRFGYLRRPSVTPEPLRRRTESPRLDQAHSSCQTDQDLELFRVLDLNFKLLELKKKGLEGKEERKFFQKSPNCSGIDSVEQEETD